MSEPEKVEISRNGLVSLLNVGKLYLGSFDETERFSQTDLLHITFVEDAIREAEEVLSGYQISAPPKKFVLAGISLHPDTPLTVKHHLGTHEVLISLYDLENGEPIPAFGLNYAVGAPVDRDTAIIHSSAEFRSVRITVLG